MGFQIGAFFPTRDMPADRVAIRIVRPLSRLVAQTKRPQVVGDDQTGLGEVLNRLRRPARSMFAQRQPLGRYGK